MAPSWNPILAPVSWSSSCYEVDNAADGNVANASATGELAARISSKSHIGRRCPRQQIPEPS